MAAPPPPPPAPPRRRTLTWGVGPRRGLVGGLIDTGALLGSAFRLLGRHWPALAAIFLAGQLAREAAMWTAVRASLVNAQLGMLILLLAPLAFLVSLVLMLRTVRPSLPWLGRPGAEPPTSVIKHLGVVLIPFMTIYYFENLLFRDAEQYISRIVQDDTERILGNIGVNAELVAIGDRTPYDLTITMAAVVLVAFVGRWLLSRWHAPDRRPWLGIPGAYLELVWFTIAWLMFLEVADQIVVWGGDRAVTRWLQSAWTVGAGTAGDLDSPLAAGQEWFTDQLGSVNTVLIVPIAWLVVGAMVLGHEPPPNPPLPGRASELYQRGSRWWSVVPRPVAWAVQKVTGDVREWLATLVQGVRLLLRGGVAPMLLFCLAFVALRTVADWLWELERLLIGPRDFFAIWLPLYVPLDFLNQTVAYVLTTCLLAATIDRAARAGADHSAAQRG